MSHFSPTRVPNLQTSPWSIAKTAVTKEAKYCAKIAGRTQWIKKVSYNSSMLGAFDGDVSQQVREGAFLPRVCLGTCLL